MESKVIEGTWEEVVRRSDELAGRHVRVTVLDEFVVSGAPKGTQPEEAEETVFDVLSKAGLIGCLKSDANAPRDLATNPIHMEGFGGE
jgi:hypothetical protein